MATYSINLHDGSLEKPQDVIVGIDLGTTNSLVAYMRNGQPVCVRGADGLVRDRRDLPGHARQAAERGTGGLGRPGGVVSPDRAS